MVMEMVTLMKLTIMVLIMDQTTLEMLTATPMEITTLLDLEMELTMVTIILVILTVIITETETEKVNIKVLKVFPVNLELALTKTTNTLKSNQPNLIMNIP